VLLVMLTVVTGVVDAVSILALGRVFVANMTGNVVFAAFALVGAAGAVRTAARAALGRRLLAATASRGATRRGGSPGGGSSGMGSWRAFPAGKG
jgi:uncharacterized membrane protein YoaK (UPF0700 family)